MPTAFELTQGRCWGLDRPEVLALFHLAADPGD